MSVPIFADPIYPQVTWHTTRSSGICMRQRCLDTLSIDGLVGLSLYRQRGEILNLDRGQLASETSRCGGSITRFSASPLSRPPDFSFEPGAVETNSYITLINLQDVQKCSTWRLMSFLPIFIMDKMHTICFLQPVTLITILLVLFVSHSLYVRFRPGLRQLPGPRLAAYSRLWNLLTASRGDAHETFQKLHQKYGKVVRTGPNHVAIADPTMIPVIYGTNNKFLKVFIHLFLFFY
jgi:hypothetical protein